MDSYTEAYTFFSENDLWDQLVKEGVTLRGVGRAIGSLTKRNMKRRGVRSSASGRIVGASPHPSTKAVGRVPKSPTTQSARRNKSHPPQAKDIDRVAPKKTKIYTLNAGDMTARLTGSKVTHASAPGTISNALKSLVMRPDRSAGALKPAKVSSYPLDKTKAGVFNIKSLITKN